MAPTASMLFLSYHQRHRPAEAAPPSRRKDEEEEESNGAAGGRVRVSLSSAMSLLARRREATTMPEAAAAKPETRRGVAGEGESEAASLESRFEEALRLSCWSS
ncbi:hypothetical protein E2562_001545 [Oryza meyeriana var. granulata]|uniref:Uncharacterized protein n=1 Tax=Oryza meyeriana var. granulata TaxID=110450 RepID=A0A6G1DC58_9ORYZ|nr:hypothetical protein E2562_001545 [Oryza meyeriana var. granulata]